MAVDVAHLGLAIDSPLVSHAANNYRPSSWPPQNEFPVMLDSESNVISRYGDATWNLSLWAGTPLVLNFGDGEWKANCASISPVNAGLLRQIVAWWLYGTKAVQRAHTLKHRFNILRALFVLCSQEKIAASDLMRYPAVADRLPLVLSPSSANNALTLLHSLYEERDKLGFILLDREGLTRLEAALPEHDSRQTPYIPPRIWTYQATRLRAFLDDFHAHRDGIEACFKFCIDAYAKNYGSLGAACMADTSSHRNPFGDSSKTDGVNRMGAQFHGPFALTAHRFGIDKLLHRWILKDDESLDCLQIRDLSAYMSMVCFVGLAYILNFSLMRIKEAKSLRANCLEIENDERFGPIYILHAGTTKTIDDDDARWPTSPSVKVAVDAMASVARLRMICAEASPIVSTTTEYIRNPHLVVRAYEPWASGTNEDRSSPVGPGSKDYGSNVKKYPRLLDLDELRITDADLKTARLVNPDLDGEIFAKGNVWPLAWHQLRRTGAVNMQASGLVSDSSLQYLLKHVTRAMAFYYGQGYSRVKLNETARITYIRTMYEVLGKEVARLFSDRFVSPHGEKRKAQILNLVDPHDSENLTKLAKSGRVTYRETLLGGCTSPVPCSVGGVENVALCGGGYGRPACSNILLDREKAPAIRQLGRVIESRLAVAPEGTPYWESLEAQRRTVESVLNVIESH